MAKPTNPADPLLPCGCVPNRLPREVQHLRYQEPCLLRIVEADLRGKPQPEPLCADPACPHHTVTSQHAFRRGWAWHEAYTSLLEERRREDAAIEAGLQDPSFPKADWRTLDDDERSRRIAHVLGLVRAADAGEYDPPSWRELGRQAGASVRKLMSFRPLVEAYRNAEDSAAIRRRESRDRHSGSPEPDRHAR